MTTSAAHERVCLMDAPGANESGVGADIRRYFEAVVCEPWWRPVRRFLADNRAITTMPPREEL